MHYARIALMIALGGLTSCATVFEGTMQEITVNTNPAGASCAFEREGRVVASIAQTPASTPVRKSKYDLTIRCDKPGYEQAIYLNHSGVTATIAGNVAADILLTAGISSIVDSASGADNQYDPVVNLTLAPRAPWTSTPAPDGAMRAAPMPRR